MTLQDAQAKIQLKEFQAAIDILDKLPEAQAHFANFLKAMAHLNLKELDKAMTAAKAAIGSGKLPPDPMGKAYMIKGQIHNELKEYIEAAEAYDNACKQADSFKNDLALLTNRAVCFTKCVPPKTDEAIQAFKEVAEKGKTAQQTPQVLGALTIALGNLASLLDDAKQYQEAIPVYDQAIQLAKTTQKTTELCTLYTNKGVAEKNLKLLEQAVDSLKKALEIVPTHQTARQNLGSTLAEMKQYGEALKYLDQKDGDSLFMRSSCLLGSGDDLGAIAAFNEAIPKLTDPVKLHNAHFNKAVLYDKVGNYEEALKSSTEAIKLKPDDGQSYFIQGIAYQKLKKPDDSINSYELTLKYNDQNVDAMINLGVLYQSLSKFDKAIESYQKSIKIKESAVTYSNMGEAFKELGKSDQAVESYGKAIQLDPNHVLAHTNRAQLYLKQNNKEKAMQDLKKVQALVQDSKNTEGLSEKNITYIKQTVAKIIEIEEFYAKERKMVEDKLSGKDTTDPKVKAILDQLNEIQKQKDEQNQKMLTGASKSDATSADALSIKEMQAQFQAMMQQIADMDKEIVVLQEEIIVQKEEIIVVKQEIDEVTEMLKLVGADKAAQVKVTYREWAENYQDGYDYAKAFYWTFINYCDAQRIAETGVIQTDASHAVDSTTQTAVKVTSAILDFGSEIPIFGGIFGAINSAIGAVYEAYEAKKEEDKRKAILKVIQQNKDANSKEEWSMLVALAGQEIARRKKQVFIERLEEKLHPKPAQGFMEKAKRAAAWVMEQVDKIKAVALGQKVELYESIGGEEACADIVVLLAFIQMNYEHIINRKGNLEIVIADIVFCDGGASADFQQMLDQIKLKEEEERQIKEAERADSSCSCQLI